MFALLQTKQILRYNSTFWISRCFCNKFRVKSSESVLESVDKNWEEILKEEKIQVDKNIDVRLSQFQKRRVKVLVDFFADMKELELSYTCEKINKEFIPLSVELNPNNIREDWPVLENIDAEGNILYSNEDYISENKQLEEVLQNPDFFERLGMPISMGGSQGSKDGGSSGKEEAQEAVAEPVQARTNWDIELTAFPADKKIAIIKDCKNIFSFGQKEAKEMVEKAPVVLKKNADVEECTTIKEKLEKLGCTITLK